MTGELTARPEALVPVAVAAYEQAWRTERMPMRLGHVVLAIAEDEARGLLAATAETRASDALRTACDVVHPVMRSVLLTQGYLPDTANRLRSLASGIMRDTLNETETTPESLSGFRTLTRRA
ncbi:hypothetical protein BZB76_5336 [Actinomadura pelletieri DSM 43383]|uniref:Uncharacterized protein n=1 Tax=Actinomadura pelletieri DSM 43383 TaxID=1120940 RepID=A0A495QG16_9ACTN|nr:hypothetical protein [Actinomadura pelletieri]RKS70856.1 hypothetical protein BZB76_5336 [Actinomadura pelletieri DSM 43383]